MSKYRKILTDLNTPEIESLKKLIATQSKATLIKWATSYCEAMILPLWRAAFREDDRPQEALEAAKEWLEGSIKLPQAKPRILQCHEAARMAESDPIAQGAARAIGQSASTIHSPRHCLGLALYGGLALAYVHLGVDAKWEDLETDAAKEIKLMEAALKQIAVENEPYPAMIEWKI